MLIPEKKRVVKNSGERLENIGVMVLDSNRVAAQLYCDMLRKLGFRRIHMVNDGFEAVQLIKKTPIHLLLTDVELKLHLRQMDPGMQNETRETIFPMSGMSMVQRLRRSPISPNPFLPIIMLLDSGHQEQVQAARDVGVNEVICKPIRVDELCSRITEIVERPRIFVTAPSYIGPCRRLEEQALPIGRRDKRKYSVCLIRYNEPKQKDYHGTV